MSEYAKTHALDVDDFEVARSIHRVVRALNDGECPKCHVLSDSTKMRDDRSLIKTPLTCPNCGFSISLKEEAAAIQTFAPVMDRNLDVFEEWRKTLLEPAQQITPAEVVERIKALPPEERKLAERMLLLNYAKPGESKFVDETRAVLEKTPTT